MESCLTVGGTLPFVLISMGCAENNRPTSVPVPGTLAEASSNIS